MHWILNRSAKLQPGSPNQFVSKVRERAHRKIAVVLTSIHNCSKPSVIRRTRNLSKAGSGLVMNSNPRNSILIARMAPSNGASGEAQININYCRKVHARNPGKRRAFLQKKCCVCMATNKQFCRFHDPFLPLLNYCIPLRLAATKRVCLDARAYKRPRRDCNPDQIPARIAIIRE